MIYMLAKKAIYFLGFLNINLTIPLKNKLTVYQFGIGLFPLL